MAIKGQSMYGGGSSAYAAVLASTALDAMLRDIEQDIVNVVMKSTPAFKVFGRERLDWRGRRAVLTIKTGINGSFSGYGEGGILPEPGASKTAQAEVFQKSVAGQFALTGQAIANTSSDSGSLARAVNIEQEALIEGIQFNVERMFWGDGNGILGKCLTNVASLISLDTTITTGFTNTTPLFPQQKIVWGTLVQLAAGTPAGYGTIVSVDADNQFTVSVVGGLAPVNATDFFCAGTYNAAKAEYAISYQKEFAGMRLMASDSATLQGLAVAGNPYWKAKILQANGGLGNINLTDDLLNRAMILYKRYLGGDKLPDMIWGTPGMQNELFKMTYSQRRFQPLEYKGGFRGDLTYNYGDTVIPFHYADMAFRNELLLMRKEDIKYSFATPLGWLLGEFNGGRVLYLDTGYNQGIGAFGADGNMWTRNRRSLMRLQEIACTDDFAQPA